jgi:hypothetical protein
MTLTLDNFCISLAALYDVEPKEYDGMMLAEISQAVSLEQLETVYDYMGIDAKCEHKNHHDTLTGAICDDCGGEYSLADASDD